MIYDLAEDVPACDRKRPVRPPTQLTGIICLCMDAFQFGRDRSPCDQRPLPVEVFFEDEVDFVEVEEAAFAFETPIFL